jgi:peptidyl-prolyl cis-trans isomerase A (cyclophilin A)
MVRILNVLAALSLVLALAPAGLRAQDAKPEEAAPAASQGATARVKMTTTLGDIVLELDGEKAPISTLNFLEYAESGFYNGTIFHRCMPGFMIQGGGYTPEMDEKKDGLREPIQNEWRNGLKNNRGTIAMARTNAPDSATAQFFINVVDNASLDRPISGGAGYAVFGKVVEGMDVVDTIKDVKKIAHPKYPGGEVTPEVPVVIQSVTVEGGLNMESLRARIAEAEEAARQAAEKEKAAEMAKIEERVQALVAEHGGEFRTTPSGLRIMTARPGTGDKSPKPTDTVEVHYRGTLIDGTEFDSSYKRNQTIEFPLNRVIRGWTEGVGLMKVGEKAILVIPPDLGYGAAGAPGAIPPNATLVFEVELVSIK